MEPVIVEWGRQHYPRLIENEKLIEALYRKKVLNRPTLIGQVTAYPLEKVANLKADKAVTVIVTKVETTVVTREVCKVCTRSPKNCHDESHRFGSSRAIETVPLYVVSMLAGDDTGMSKFQRIGTDKDAVEVLENSDVFVITGSLKVNEKWGSEFSIRSFAPLSLGQKDAWDSIDDFYSIHGGEMGISEEEFEKVIGGRQDLLATIFERVYIDKRDGRVRF